ncbi:copper resistance protein CopC [Glycomyces sp. NPDC047010]|uniref:copper resistance CopC/CopD family protein n=1 Tax=Glycomyces sp. NPDC047010 TaxID=3155023 RepID=UPI0033C822CD
MTATRSHLPGRAILPALAALLLALAPAAPAQAHAALLATDPPDRAALDIAPDVVTLTFNEPVQPVADAMRLVDGNGTEQDLAATASDTDVVVDLPELADGPYYVNWRVISADAHPISGVLSFTVGTGTAPPPPTESEAAEPDRPWAVQTVNIAFYAGLLLCTGYALFRTVIARRLAPARPRHRLLRAGGLLAVLAAALAVPVGALDLAGRPLTDLTDTGAWAPTVQTGAITVLAATAVGIALTCLGTIRPGRRWSTLTFLVGAAIALLAPVLIGHTMAFGPRWLMVAADAVHLATAAIWIGGITGIGILLLRRNHSRLRDAATVIARFSTWAGYSVAALGASGIAMAWAIHRSWASLFESDHGRVLLIKLGLVAVALALAGWNRYRLVPLVQGTDPAAGLARLRRTVRAEAAVLAAVIAVTGVLVNLPPGVESAPPAATEPVAPVPETIDLIEPLGDGEAHLQGTTTGIGEHSFTLALTGADGAPLTPLESPAITALLPERDFGPVDAQIHEYGPGQYHCIIDLPLTGAWTLTLQVRASEFDSLSTGFDITVS